MQLLKLRLFHFRNLCRQEIRLSPGTNLFRGLNGQGKTNLLEAIYFLGYGKSFRTAKPRECIRHGESEASVEGEVSHGGISRDLQVVLGRDEKKLMVHGKCTALDEYVGLFDVVAFTSSHLSVVRGGPVERRAFLDRAMVTVYPGHLRLLASYGRALKHRNRLLSQFRDSGGALDEALLQSWDETLCRDGARIVMNRLNYVGRMKEELHADLFGAEILKIHYLGTVCGEILAQDRMEARFRERLHAAREADRKLGFTTVGPHRDDLRLYADGKALACYGSAGQQRSSLLALYFAQMEIHRKEQGFYPVFLVDDVEAELDDRRLRTFLDHLSEQTQTFLATAKESLLPILPEPIRSYEVTEGTVVASA